MKGHLYSLTQIYKLKPEEFSHQKQLQFVSLVLSLAESGSDWRIMSVPTILKGKILFFEDVQPIFRPSFHISYYLLYMYLLLQDNPSFFWL